MSFTSATNRSGTAGPRGPQSDAISAVFSHNCWVVALRGAACARSKCIAMMDRLGVHQFAEAVRLAVLAQLGRND
jgi:hypothetical protein